MALLCHCWVVGDRAIAAAVESGADSLDEVQDHSGAGTACGVCLPALEAALDRCRSRFDAVA